MSSTDAVRIRRLDGNIEAELADVERGNPLAPELVDGLLAAVAAAEDDPSCRALLISATGPRFCSGLNLTAIPPGWLTDPADMPPWRLFERLRTARTVTVALVDGSTTGGGVALAAACDLVIAGAAATFRFTEVLLGLVPAMALPFVAHRVGGQRAFRMALIADEVDATEAVRIGLADMTAPRAADGVPPLFRALRRATPDTLRAMKRTREQLFPEPPRLGEIAGRATLARLDDPDVTARIERMIAAGVLR
jgi:polyketide biosynthesis enoyl-CoA hydratase PksH